MTRILVLALFLALVAPAAAQDSLRIVRATPPQQQAPASNFTGVVRLGGGFSQVAPATVSGATVAFEPGARTNWHTHALGQTLIIMSGTGRVQHWGGTVREVRQGDVVVIPPGVKHWHGATATSPMSHVSFAERPAQGSGVQWMEPVTDVQFGAGQAAPATSGPSRAQSIMGDIAPELARLTDEVLFGQVWSRPGLSQRDRSLITVAALIALNRPEQMRSHMARGRANGLTEEEIVETITQLAFYAGWPSAITAVGVAREVFRQPASQPAGR